MIFWPPASSKVSDRDSPGTMGLIPSVETFEGVPVVVDEFYRKRIVCAFFGKI